MIVLVIVSHFFFQSAFQVLKVMDREVQLKYMEEVKQNIYKWPTTLDISTEPLTNIVQTLPFPDLVEELSSSRIQFFTFKEVKED